MRGTRGISAKVVIENEKRKLVIMIIHRSSHAGMDFREEGINKQFA